MKRFSGQRIIFWLPRVLSLGVVVFLSLFSLDVFSSGVSWESVLGFVIHSIPSLIVLVITVLAWKRSWVGVVGFWGLAVLYVVMVGLNRHWSWYVGIGGPLVVVGLLYVVGRK